MTQKEKLTIINRASKVFQEWLSYLQESGTKFNLCPREDIDEAFTHWNNRFTTALEEELNELEEKNESNRFDDWGLGENP